MTLTERITTAFVSIPYAAGWIIGGFYRAGTWAVAAVKAGYKQGVSPDYER